MKTLRYILFFLMFTYSLNAQNTTSIPDSEFEQVLIDKGIDSDGILNGQVFTDEVNDLLELKLTNNPQITSLTGLEDFTSLKKLVIFDLGITNVDLKSLIDLEFLNVNLTNINNLDVTNLLNLKHLSCYKNNLTSLDVSKNPALEYLNLTTNTDNAPVNFIEAIDLSNNPAIDTLIATGGEIEKVNLNNGNNNSNMVLDIALNGPNNGGSDTWANICIKVDNVSAAQNNQTPYSDWEILDQSVNYYFTSDLEQCSTLSLEENEKTAIAVYPNPVKNYLNVENFKSEVQFKVFNLSGKLILQQKINSSLPKVNMSGFSAGLYLYELNGNNQVLKQGKLVKE